jgi:hypothetical protein
MMIGSVPLKLCSALQTRPAGSARRPDHLWPGLCDLAESKRQYSQSRGDGGLAAQGTAFAFRSFVREEKIGTEDMPNRAQQIFKPEFRFGLGGVSLGNEFNKHTDKEAERTLEAAWDVGVRYFDVAPWYGFGLAERRFGHFLHNKRRDDYLLSSKVGKLFKASKNNRHAEIYPLSDSPKDIVFDYTADAVRRSIEDSLQRLGLDSLDVAFVHDISPDFAYFPNGWEEQYEMPARGRSPRCRRCATRASYGPGASA